MSRLVKSLHPKGEHNGHKSIVSTHTPTRGATLNSPLDYILMMVSTRAPTRGATSCSAAVSCFSHVSIHAPTRGATVHPLNTYFTGVSVVHSENLVGLVSHTTSLSSENDENVLLKPFANLQGKSWELALRSQTMMVPSGS